MQLLHSVYRDKIRTEKEWYAQEKKRRQKRAQQPDGIRGIIEAAAKRLLPGSEPQTPADTRAPKEEIEQITKEREDLLAVLKLKRDQDNGGDQSNRG
jgi:hypothetical protein